MARILVTGASGFIGSHVAERLAASGHRVVASGRSLERLQLLQSTAERLMVADLCTDPPEPLAEACDAVVHCAALSSPWGTAESFSRANVLATRRLLEASQRVGVRRFIHMGSPSIHFRFADQYGIEEAFEPPRRWITEYARSKWESELCVRSAAANGLEALVLRPRAVFGERDQAILPRLMAIADRGWFPLIHRGDAVIDVTYVANLSGLVAQCLEADVVADGRAYNVTNGEPIRVGELIAKLFSAMDRQVRLVPVPRGVAVAAAGIAERIARIRPGRPEPRLTRYGIGVLGYSQTLDISLARRELGYAPAVSIDQGIERYAQWWKRHARA
ncbi:MAG TPA: NAD(P)-dependent oxidoreductase [Pseudoxanthomonas sp.]